MPSEANAMGTRRNVVLYLDEELIAEFKSLSFKLGKKENEKAETKYGCLYFCFSVSRVSRGE